MFELIFKPILKLNTKLSAKLLPKLFFKLIVLFLIGLSYALLFFSSKLSAQTIKDLTQIEGVRTNQLLGYGLVVGLNGTGDLANSAPFTAQSFNNLLQNFGIKLPENIRQMQLKNIAAVAVTADLPPFARVGQKIDVTISSIGNAKSLRGGSLLLTELKGIDGQIYALAQGNLLVSGISADGKNGNKIDINISSVGRIPAGATIEQTLENTFNQTNKIMLNLRKESFSTAQNIARAVNQHFGKNKAQAINSATVKVKTPSSPNAKVAFIAKLENLNVPSAREPAKVIINARTGTVVINQNVRVSSAAVTHGNISVSVGAQTNIDVNRRSIKLERKTNLNIEQQASSAVQFTDGANLDAIVQSIQQLGAGSNDLIAILQALKEAGALQAELVII